MDIHYFRLLAIGPHRVVRCQSPQEQVESGLLARNGGPAEELANICKRSGMEVFLKDKGRDFSALLARIIDPQSGNSHSQLPKEYGAMPMFISEHIQAAHEQIDCSYGDLSPVPAIC